MKTPFTVLPIICFLIFSCSKPTISSTIKNDVSYYGFNGKVKSVKSEVFNLIPEKDTFKIGKKINGISFDQNSLLEFNHFGNLVSLKEFLADGKVRGEMIYTYDKNNRLTKRREIDSYGKGSVYDYEFSYNSQDSVTQVIFSDDNFRRVHKIERDEKNRPIKSEVIQNDTILTTYIVMYDQNNNVVTENEFRNKDTPVKLIERIFNKQNLKVKEQVVEYNTWDTLNYENRFTYDKNKNLVLEKYNIEYDSIFTEVKNTYHKNGKLKESTRTPKGSSYFVIRAQKFNENGDLIEYSRDSNDDEPKEVWSYNFKYDPKNNWIEKVEFKDNKPLRIVKRTIEYYK